MGASLLLLSAALLLACSPVPAERGGAEANSGRPEQPKRITMGIGSNLPSPNSSISAPLSGNAEIMLLVSSGLTAQDEYDRTIPVVADAVPTVENGLWRLLPDGRMETTWRLRDGFTWHDGAPVTADDYAFAMQVARDRDLAPFYSALFANNITAVESPDARTVTVTWRQPYIHADQLFTTIRTMPRHLLERTYVEEKETFKDLPFWTSEHVSNGPYRLTTWETGVHAVLDAFDDYRLGRPKIDQIEVRFIADPNTMLANVLADALDVLVGARHLGFDQGVEAQQRWQGGTVVFGANGWSVLHPQMAYASPRIIQESAQFRRAMFTATDRQSMADSLQGGLAPVAHSIFVPTDPLHEPTLARLVRYDHDPRRATQLIEELGYRKGVDGSFVDASGQPLRTEIRTTSDIETTVKQMFAMSDSWTRIGVPTDTVSIPPQRQQDREYRSTFPGFEVLQGGQGEAGLISRTIANARTAQNNWTGAGATNYSNYLNPEHDAMIARFLSTIPTEERTRIAGDLLNHLSDQALYLGIYYIARPTVVRNGLIGTVGRDAGTVATHNVLQWDLSR
jgi:peptide/nickel transport system substrate-binding protein